MHPRQLLGRGGGEAAPSSAHHRVRPAHRLLPRLPARRHQRHSARHLRSEEFQLARGQLCDSAPDPDQGVQRGQRRDLVAHDDRDHRPGLAQRRGAPRRLSVRWLPLFPVQFAPNHHATLDTVPPHRTTASPMSPCHHTTPCHRTTARADVAVPRFPLATHQAQGFGHARRPGVRARWFRGGGRRLPVQARSLHGQAADGEQRTPAGPGDDPAHPPLRDANVLTSH